MPRSGHVVRRSVLIALVVALGGALGGTLSGDPSPEPSWERLFGPPGGYVERLALCPSAPDTIYASGSPEGIYKTTDRGDSWSLLRLPHGGVNAAILLIDPRDPNVVYAGYEGLAKSSDGGRTWRPIAHAFAEQIWIQEFASASDNPDTLYVAGARHDRTGCAVYRSTDGGERWSEIGPRSLPGGTDVGGLAIQRGGVLFLGINDRTFRSWGAGRVFVSRDDGRTWSETDYGTTEDRFIWSLLVNPWASAEVWISEGPLHNEGIGQPLLFRSADDGRRWTPVRINAHGWDSTQVRVIGAGPDGSVYVAAGSNLLVAENEGRQFTNRTPPQDRMSGVDFFDIVVHPSDPAVLYLPLRASGIGYSEDGGRTWTRRDDGIASISANLIETDPFRPGTVYASSIEGQGVYRSDDYGATWTGSLAGITHPFGDEIVPDPHHDGVVYFIADVPHVFRSDDRGDTWTSWIDPTAPGGFNFGSVYALAQGRDRNRIYVVDNGFGIFRGDGGAWTGHWDWRFLRSSEIDYTYTLVVDPADEAIVYSGCSSKPFQDYAMIRRSADGGDTWTTALTIDGADAVSSIDVDEGAPERVFAASTSLSGGAIWRSDDRGRTWRRPNPTFDFTTVHTFATAPSDPSIVYTGVWGGGTFVTANGGAHWAKLDAPEAFSAAGIAVDPNDPQTIYVADRTTPALYRSHDGGDSFEVLFAADERFARLMGVTIDPANPDCLYTIAMKRPDPIDRHPGMRGSLFRVESGEATDVTGDLPRMPLSITVDPADSATLYAVLHGYGIFKSTDRAASWTEISGPASGLPHSGFLSIVVDPHDGETLYLIGGCDVRFGSFASAGLDPDLVHGVYRSDDGGRTWTSVNAGVLGAGSGTVKSLAFSAEDPDLLVAGAESGLFVSTDRGASWTRDRSLPFPALGGAVLASDRVLAMTNGAGVFRGTLSRDGSIAWGSESVLSIRVFFAQVIVDASNPGTVYASGYPGGIFKSTDDGATWHEANFGMTSFAVDDPLRQGYYAFALAASDPSVLYLGLYGRGVYKSVDAAGTWMPANGVDGTMVDRYVTALAVDPEDADRVFVATENGVLRTDDGGQTWRSADDGLPTTDVRTIAFTPAGELFAGTRGYGLFRYLNGQWRVQNPVGEWGVIWPIWDDRPRYQYSDMLFHPTDEDRLLFGSFPAGIYASDDGGRSWRESNVGWTFDGVFSLVSHPENREIVYAGTYNGVNRSLDFGGRWETWDAGWPPEQWVFTIAFDPRDPDVMYACSKNGENEGTGRPGFHGTVMKSLDGGATWFAITDGLSLDQEFYDLVVDPYNPDVVYLAAQAEGMFVSRDAGASWTRWNEGLDGRIPATDGNNVTRVLALSADGRYLYFGSEGAGVFRREIHPEVLTQTNDGA